MSDPATDWRHYPLTSDLVALVAVAEHGGMGAAARALGLAQPNLSRAVRRLEAQLRLPLVTRASHGSTLTAQGALVVDWARSVLAANQHLVVGTRALAGGHAGPLRVAASQTIAEDLLPRWLAVLHAAEPEVDIALTVANSSEVGRVVSAGGTLGFIESPGLPPTVTVPVHHRTVAVDQLVIVVAPDHPWARAGRPIGLDELLATPLVVREPGSGTRVSFETALAGRAMAPSALELGSNTAVRMAVAAGAGPAVLSELAVRAAVAAGELCAVAVEGLRVERRLRAIWPRDGALPAAAARLVRLAHELGGRPRS